MHFEVSQTLTVAEAKECLEACDQAASGTCRAFYLETDGVTCRLGSFVTADSGLGEALTSAQTLYSDQLARVGEV